MTTKTYNLIEIDQNGDQLEVKSYGTRFEAVQAMATRLTTDDTTQPQNFRIEEAEVKTKTELLVEELVAKLNKYGDEWIVTQEKNRATICRSCGLWTSAVLMDIVEFMQQPEYADHGFHINSEGRLVIFNKE